MARNNRKTSAPAAPPEADDRTMEFRRGDTGEQPAFADLARSEPWSSRDVPPAVLTPAPARARTGLVTTVTFVLLLVVVAAGGNQAVSDKLADRVARMGQGYLPAGAALTYGWRFSPRGAHDVGHAWLAQLVSVAAFVVLATLLVAPVVRGVVTWFRAFVGVLGAVVVATALAEIVGEAIRTGSAATPRGITRAERILFFSSDGPTVLASLVVGLGAALVIATVAVATRRAPAARVAPPAAEPDQSPTPDAPPAYYGEPDDAWRGTQPEAAPAFAEPPTAGPPTAEPPTTGPPIAEPPTAGPPTAGPPIAEPPVAAPPIAEPTGGDRWEPASGPWNAPRDSATEGLVGAPAPEAPRHVGTHAETQAEPVREAGPEEATSTIDVAAINEPNPHQAGDATQQFPRLPDDEHEHGGYDDQVADEDLPHREDRPGTSS